MLLQFGLTWQETIQAAIQPRVVDLAFRDVQQIVQRCGWIPVLFDGQFATGSTQPVDRQHYDYAGPRNIGDLLVQMSAKKLLQPQTLPSLPPKLTNTKPTPTSTTTLLHHHPRATS